MTRQELVYVVKKVHSIFNGLTKKELALIAAGPPGRTDTQTYVSVSIEDPDADLVLKHEWSHVIFKTNLFALSAFAERMADEITAQYGTRREDVVEAVYAITNALDDLRCNSLWALLYADNAERIAARWRRLASGHPATHLIVRIIGIGTGQVTVRTNNPPMFDVLALEAIALVRRRGYSSVLVACRRLLLHYLEGMVGQAAAIEPDVLAQPGQATTMVSPRPGARAAIDRINTGRTKAKFMDTDTRVRGNDPDPESTERMVGTALLSEASPSEIEATLDAEGAAVRTVAAHLAEQRLVIDEDGHLLEGAQAVSFVDLHPAKVRRVELGDQDFAAIETLRAMFSRALSNRRSRATDAGAELDPERYIDMLLGSGDSDIFKDDTASKGFYAMVLLDMSGSMAERWPVVSRACQVLADALTFPFVRLDVWAFSSGGDGQTEIYRFTDPWAGVAPIAGHLRMWGMTPIHSVLPVVFKHGEKQRGHRHVFLLSDGTPTALSARPSELHGAVAKAREAGQRRGVQMSTLLVGNITPPWLADVLYGQHRWSRAEDNQFSLFDELVDLIGRTFLTHLRRSR